MFFILYFYNVLSMILFYLDDQEGLKKKENLRLRKVSLHWAYLSYLLQHRSFLKFLFVEKNGNRASYY